MNGETVSAHGKEKECFLDKFVSKPLKIDEIQTILATNNLLSSKNYAELLKLFTEHSLSTTKKVHEKNTTSPQAFFILKCLQ